MKLAIIDKEFGLGELKGQPVVSSRYVAKVFGKRHDVILRNISNIIETSADLNKEFTDHNFVVSEYKDTTGRKLPEYLLTRDGFTLLVMGFTGKKAFEFKVAYIQRFNQMEEYILTRNSMKLEFPELTKAISEAHEEPKFYHFANELNLINRIVLGVSAKEFKEVNNLGAVNSIRPYLTNEQLHYIGLLQRADIMLVLTEQDYDKRKEVLQTYYNRLTKKQIAGNERNKCLINTQS